MQHSFASAPVEKHAGLWRGLLGKDKHTEKERKTAVMPELPSEFSMHLGQDMALVVPCCKQQLIVSGRLVPLYLIPPCLHPLPVELEVSLLSINLCSSSRYSVPQGSSLIHLKTEIPVLGPALLLPSTVSHPCWPACPSLSAHKSPWLLWSLNSISSHKLMKSSTSLLLRSGAWSFHIQSPLW